MALGHGDFDLAFSLLREGHDRLSSSDDLPFLRRDVRDHAVRACNEIRVAECVAARAVLRDGLAIGCLGGTLIRTVLVEHRLGDRLRGIELLVACTLRAREFVARERGLDGGVRCIYLLLHVACVDHHENIARADVCADIDVA